MYSKKVPIFKLLFITILSHIIELVNPPLNGINIKAVVFIHLILISHRKRANRELGESIVTKILNIDLSIF